MYEVNNHSLRLHYNTGDVTGMIVGLQLCNAFLEKEKKNNSISWN